VRGVQGEIAPVAPLEQAARIDTDYTAAVERGDMEAAQRMVDEAASAQGYTVEAFHGTPEGGFTEFNESPSGLFFTNKPSVAQGYTYFRNPWLSPSNNAAVYRTRLRMQNPLVIDAGGARNNNIQFPGREYQRTVFGRLPEGAVSVEEAARLAFESGYDGIIINNVMDSVSVDDKTRSTVYVVPAKEQAKLADPVTYDEQGNVIPLSRRFDITSPRIFEQAAASPAFYSALEQEVAAIDSKTLTAASWNERLKGLVNKGAIKADELEWSGLGDYLKMQEGKVSKDTVLEFLRGNGVRVERVQMGGMTLEDLRNEHARAEMEYDDALEAERVAQQGTDEEAWNAADARLSEARRNASVLAARLDEAERAAAPKYQRYTLPGGTNYREVLLTLPAEDRLPVGYSVVQQEGVWKIADNSGNIVMGDVLYGATKAIATRNAISYLKSGQITSVFQSSHWNQPNVLVHLRLNDRVDAEGERVLFVEEVQSDWGQAGRKTGFSPTAARRQAITDEYNAAQAELAAAIPGTDEQASAYERVDRAEQAYNKEINDASIPRAPFVETTDGWLNLGLKQIMLEAMRGGYDRVAFVTGQQSAERYQLSKDVRNISWNSPDGRSSGSRAAIKNGATKTVTITLLNGDLIAIPIDDRGVAISTDTQFKGKPLDEIVPKEIADQVMAEQSGDISGDGPEGGGEGKGYR